MYSLLIKNARVIDGSGKPEKLVDVACSGNLITNIAAKIDSPANIVIDAKGKILAPGFVDIQNHSDSYWQIFDNPDLDSLVKQGFTTILVGNCGASLAPLLSRDALLAIQKWHNLDGVNINWQSFGEFANEMSKRKFGCNIGSLVGYSTLRRGLIGDQVRSLDNDELDVLKKTLNDSLNSGAFGLSSGLAYAHEIIISELELFELAKVVAKHEALFSMHLRNEEAELSESVEEALEIARRTKVNLKISHFKIRDKQNHDQLKNTLEVIETEHYKGLNVHFDVYPYDTIWQVLFSYLPKWAIEGGRSFWTRQLQDPIQRNKIISHLSATGINFDEMIVTSTASKLNMIGKKLSEIAKNLGVSTEEAVLQIIDKGGNEVMVFDQSLDWEQVEELTRHPLSMIATDGGGFANPEKLLTQSLNAQNKLVHPRCFGTSAKFLRQVIETKKISLEAAIWKLSGLPAKKIGLKKRGTIEIGNFADLVIFDPEKIIDKATALNPYQFSEGIEYVFVNGEASFASQRATITRAGDFLRKT